MTDHLDGITLIKDTRDALEAMAAHGELPPRLRNACQEMASDLTKALQILTKPTPNQ